MIFLLKIIALSTRWFNDKGRTSSNRRVIANLIEDRKIIIAENLPLREAYENDKSNFSLHQLNSCLDYARENGLTMDMDNQLPAIVGTSNPVDIDSIHFAFITKEEIMDNIEWKNYHMKNQFNEDNFSIEYGDINENLFRKNFYFPKGTEVSVIENFFDGYTKWAKRITIWDQYMLEDNNIEGTIRFLDFLNEKNLQLKKIDFVTKPDYRNAESDDGKKAHFTNLFKSRILSHPIFENIELVRIGWQGKSSQRYLSFGNDASEITFSFTDNAKSISDLFNFSKGDLTSKNFSYSLLPQDKSYDLLNTVKVYDELNLEK